MTQTIEAGAVLAAADALRNRRGHGWTDEQVAFLVDLARRSGLAEGRAYDTAEMLATWAEKHTEPPTRRDRIAAEIAAAGPVRFYGGLPKPPTYFPADPDRVRPRFPTLQEQSAWLAPEDVDFCRRYARERTR